MQFARKIAAPWQIYRRSPHGLWVRATRTEEAIRLEWQVRTLREGGRIRTLDANGDVIVEVPVHEARWGDPWALAGAVPLDDAFADWAGPQRFDACVDGAMRHLVGLLAAGYGDTPEEIVGWFQDLDRQEWLVPEATYSIARDVPPIEGLCGAVGTLKLAPEPALHLRVGERSYAIPLDTREALQAFLCATEINPNGG